MFKFNTIFNRNFISETLCKSLFFISPEDFLKAQKKRLANALDDSELLAILELPNRTIELMKERADENEVELFCVLELLGDDFDSLMAENDFLLYWARYKDQRNENFTSEKKENELIEQMADLAICSPSDIKKELENIF